MDQRLAKISKFPGLKIFSHGIQTIAHFTIKEYREFMKIIVFVIDNLYNNTMQNKEYFVKNKKLAKLYKIWNEIYEISRYKKFSKKDLKKFKII